jgi:hypothetical protein
MHLNRGISKVSKLCLLFLVAIGLTVQTPMAAAAAPTTGTLNTITTSWSNGADPIAITPPTSNSDGAWSYTSSNTGVMIIFAGAYIVIKGVGTTVITATQAATATYEQVVRTRTFTVLLGVPTLGTFPAISIGIDARTLSITEPTSSSTGAWSYTSSNPAVVNLSGTVATLVSIGSATITATQAASGNWASISIQATLTVSGGAPTLGVFADVLITKGVIASTTLVPPISNSSGSWTFTSSNLNVATITGSLLIPVALGTTVITAQQGPAGIYGAGSKAMTVTIVGPPPTVGALVNVTFELKPFNSNEYLIVAPASNSSGAWSYTSSNLAVATTSGSVIKALALGTTTITAIQAASSTYAASVPVTMVFTVVGAGPVLGVWADLKKSIGDPDFTIIPPTTSSAGAWTFTSSNPAVIEITGTSAKIKGAGQVIITGTQAANWNWSAGTAQLTITVAGTLPAVLPLVAFEAGLGDAPVALLPPSSTSTGAWAWVSSNIGVATVSGNILTIVGVGTSTITAMQSAAGNFAASPAVVTTLTVKPRPVAGEFSNLVAKFGLVLAAVVPPTSTSTGVWSYSSSNPTVVNFVSGAMQIVGIGSATISAKQAPSAVLSAITKTFTVTILPVAPTIMAPIKMSVVFSATAKAIAPFDSNSSGIWTHSILDSSIAQVVDGQLVTKKAGQTILTAVQGAAGNYTSRSISISFIVKPYIKVSAIGRAIYVEVAGVKPKIKIGLKTGKVGKNVVGPGNRLVSITVGGIPIYKKSFKIK